MSPLPPPVGTLTEVSETAAEGERTVERLGWTRFDGLALAFLALLALALVGPMLVGRADFPPGDFVDQFYAFARLATRELAQGRPPLWNPYTFSGHPFLADIQSGVLYPPNLVMLLLAAWTRGDLPLRALYGQVALHLFLAGAFTYLLARRRLGDRWGALLAALTFALGGYLTSYPPLQLAILQTDAWLPLLLLLVDRALSAQGGHLRHLPSAIRLPPSTFPLALVWALVLLPGHPQSALYVGYATLAWAIYRAWALGVGWWRGAWLVAVSGALGLALAAAQWLPSVQYTRLSVRAAASYDMLAHGFPFRDLVGVLIPGVVSQWSPLYVGLLPLALAVFAVVHAGRRWDTAFWSGLGLVALLLSFGGGLFVYPLFYWLVPGFNLFQSQERSAFLVSFTLALLAGAGLTRLLEGRRRKPGGGQLALPPSACRLLPSVVVVVAALDLLRVAAPLLIGPPLPADLGYALALIAPLQAAPGPVRVENEYRLPANYGVLFGIEDTWGASPLRTQRYADFVAAVPAERRRRLLNVGFFLTWHGDVPGMTEVARQPVTNPTTGAAETTFLLKTDPGPRAWLVNATETLDDGAALARLADPPFDPWQVGILAPDGPSLALTGGAPGTTVYHRLSPLALAVDVDTAADALLMLSEAWYPGWTATVDGQAAPVVRADVTLMAVPVSAGAHRVEVRFDPPFVKWGLAVSGLALLLVVVGWWRRGR